MRCRKIPPVQRLTNFVNLEAYKYFEVSPGFSLKMGPKKSSSPTPTSRKRTSAAAGNPPDARDHDKDVAAKESARAYVESLKKGKKVEVDTPPPTEKKARRSSRGSSTPELTEDDEEVNLVSTRGRASSRTSTSNTNSDSAEPVKRTKSPTASMRATKIADVLAAVEAVSSTVASLSTTTSPSRQKPSPSKASREPSPAKAPVSKSESSTSAAQTSSATSVSPLRHLSPKVVIVSAAAAMRRKSLSPVRQAGSSGDGAFAGMAVGTGREELPQVPEIRSIASERAVEKARSLVGVPVSAITSPIVRDSSSNSSNSDTNTSQRAIRGGGFDVPVEVHVPPMPSERRAVRFTDGGSPGQLTPEESKQFQANSSLMNPPVWVEYVDGIAVLIVLSTGFYVFSSGSTTAVDDASHLLAAPSRFFSTSNIVNSTGREGSFSILTYMAVALVVVAGTALFSSGLSNFVMGFFATSNSSAARVEVAGTHATTSAHSASITPASPTPPVPSAPTAGILRNTERRLSAGHTPGKALLDRERSISPATAPRSGTITTAQAQETNPPASFMEQLLYKVQMAAAAASLLLALVAFLSYPSWMCLYCSSGSLVLGSGLIWWKRYESARRREELVDVLARLVKDRLRTMHAGASYPADYMFEDIKECCQDKRWPSGTSKFVRELSVGELKSSWPAALAAVKEDKRVVVTDDTRHGGVKLEHLRFIGDVVPGRAGISSGLASSPLKASTGTSSNYQYVPKNASSISAVASAAAAIGAANSSAWK